MLHLLCRPGALLPGLQGVSRVEAATAGREISVGWCAYFLLCVFRRFAWVPQWLAADAQINPFPAKAFVPLVKIASKNSLSEKFCWPAVFIFENVAPFWTA